MMGYKITRKIKTIKFKDTCDEWICLLIETGFIHPIWNKGDLSEHSILGTNNGGHLSGNHIMQETGHVVHLRASGIQSQPLHGWGFNWACISDNIRTWMRFETRSTNNSDKHQSMLSGMKQQVFNFPVKCCWVCLHFNRARWVKRPLDIMEEMASTLPPVNKERRKKGDNNWISSIIHRARPGSHQPIR